MVRAATEYLPLGAAVERVTGRRFHPSTICRWHRKGVHGVRLEARVIGGRPMTTTELVEAFFDATTAAAGPAAEGEGGEE